MATFTTNKGMIQPDPGSFNDTWGPVLNQQVFAVADAALAGHTTIDVTGVAAGVISLTQTQYVPPNIIFIGAISAALVYALPPGIGWLGSIFNNTTGAQTLIFASSGGGSIALPQGKRTAVVCDGVNVQSQQSATNEGAPTALVGLTAVSGSAGTVMDSASAPAIDQAIVPTWTGTHTFADGFNVDAASNINGSLNLASTGAIDARLGVANVATQTTADATTLAASTAFVHNVSASFAPLVSPAFTGTPTAPTPASGDSDTSIATTAFVNPGSSISGTSGYSIRPDGSIEMWGITASGGNIVTTAFPTIAGAGASGFPNACRTVQFNPFSNTDWFVSNPSASRTGFTVTLGASGAQGCWFAIGS